MGNQARAIEANFKVVRLPKPPEHYLPNVPASAYPVGTEIVMLHDNQTRFVVKDDQRDGKYWERIPWTQED